MKQILLMALLLMLFGICAFGKDALREDLQSQTRYWGIHEKMTSTDLDRLVELKQKTEQADLTLEQRTKAFTDLFQFVQKLRGFPEGRVPAAMAANLWSPGQSPTRPAMPRAKAGELANYIKQGSGSTAMILIPDIAMDRTVFDSFMKRNHSQFTFYAVTLPGFGGTDPPPAHEKLDFGKLQWWNNANAAVLGLIKNEKIERPLILGHQAGSYLGMRLALEHPELIRGVVVLNGLLYAPLPPIPADAGAQERVRIVNSFTPAELFPRPSQSHYQSVMMQGAAWFCKNKKAQESFVKQATRSDSSVYWNYFAELATTDLTQRIKTIKVPMLVLPSVHDRESPGFETSKVALDQWGPLDRSKSSLPITVIKIEDCRAYATEDQPAKLDEAIRIWTAQLSK